MNDDSNTELSETNPGHGGHRGPRSRRRFLSLGETFSLQQFTGTCTHISVLGQP